MAREQARSRGGAGRHGRVDGEKRERKTTPSSTKWVNKSRANKAWRGERTVWNRRLRDRQEAGKRPLGSRAEMCLVG